jgi:hypothetical protein
MAAGLPNPKPQRAAWQALLGIDGLQEESRPSVIVSITRFSTVALDIDNFAGGCKYLIDQLRAAKLIPGDAPAEIEVRFRQLKTQKKNEEGTRIEIETRQL